VGLGHRLDRRPPELSGGEQQRVAVARALAGHPRLVWADEPTGNLDSEMAHAVMELLGELHREGLTIVLVTHDRTVASYADRLLTVRDGRLVGDERLGDPTALAETPVERVDRSVQTEPRAKPAPPDDGTASGASDERELAHVR
jgi:putative ABC transport system ATP-binding protein